MYPCYWPHPPHPPGEAWYTLFAHARNIPSFKGIHKIAYTYRTVVAYTNRACSFKGLQAPGDLLLAKGCIVPVSVVKADGVQGGGATNRVRREISILWLSTGLFGKSISVGPYVWILPLLKSSIPADPS